MRKIIHGLAAVILMVLCFGAAVMGQESVTAPLIANGNVDKNFTSTSKTPTWTLVAIAPDGYEIATASLGGLPWKMAPAPPCGSVTYTCVTTGYPGEMKFQGKIFEGTLRPKTSGKCSGGGEITWKVTANAENYWVEPDDTITITHKQPNVPAVFKAYSGADPADSTWTITPKDGAPAAPALPAGVSATILPGGLVGKYTVTGTSSTAPSLSDSGELVVVPNVEITGFSWPDTHALASDCPAERHQQTCYATIQPSGVSAITYSIPGDAHGATIDAAKGVITPSATESGTITVRAAATIAPDVYAEQSFLIKARPMEVKSSQATKWPVPVGGEWVHTFVGTGGSLEGEGIYEQIDLISWPFLNGDFEALGTWTLDADGVMTDSDLYYSPSINFKVLDFVPSPPKAGLPQTGTMAQKYKWYCPECEVIRDIEQSSRKINMILFKDTSSPSGYKVKIETEYEATGEPIEFDYGGDI